MPRSPSAPRYADGDVLVLVGTTKGAFILSSNQSRRRWTVDGPHFPGETVYSVAHDQRGGRRRTLVGSHSNHWGSTIRVSDDYGATWTGPERQAVRFPEGSGLSLAQVWQITPGRREEPDVVWCGVEPAALFRSDDAGENWAPVQGLLEHEHRKQWMPGGGGLCLHTIVLDPTDARRMAVAISTAGFYRSDDGGATWKRTHDNRIDKVFHSFGYYFGRIAVDPADPERVYIQGVPMLTSTDGGKSWRQLR